MTWAPLADAGVNEAAFGGKAAALSVAVRAGLPVPPGLALAASFVDAVGEGQPGAVEALAALPVPAGALAVRSSAIGEDSAGASFAGQHASILNVQGAEALVEAVRAVWRSARTESALAYRERMGIEGPPCMGVVVQLLAPAEVAGVLFTRNPLTGADERVIEAAWGLGEAVVQGLVVPDRYRVSRAGEVLERTPGRMRVAVRPRADGSTAPEPLDAAHAGLACLDDARLQALHELALACERVWEGAHDLEWAFAGGEPVLLQRRPITSLGGVGRAG
jgi:pyruvate,water dikinase